MRAGLAGFATEHTEVGKRENRDFSSVTSVARNLLLIAILFSAAAAHAQTLGAGACFGSGASSTLACSSPMTVSAGSTINCDVLHANSNTTTLSDAQGSYAANMSEVTAGQGNVVQFRLVNADAGSHTPTANFGGGDG